MVRVCHLHIISRNYSNTHLCINLQKRKTCSKWNIELRAFCSDIRILTSLDRFLSLLNVYFNDVQMNRWLYLTRSLREFPSLRLVQKKNRPEKYPFIATISWTVLAVWWSWNIFLIRIPCYSRKVVEERRRREVITKLFAFQANAIIVFTILSQKTVLLKLKLVL